MLEVHRVLLPGSCPNTLIIKLIYWSPYISDNLLLLTMIHPTNTGAKTHIADENTH